MRHLLFFILITCLNHSFSQSTDSMGLANNLYLSQMQDFIQKNESSNTSDSVKRQDLFNKIRSFITEHPAHELNFTFIYWGINLSYKQAAELVSLVDSSIQHSATRAWADITLKRLAVAETGKPFPHLTLTDTAGNELLLADLKGKVILLDVWSSWCVPCREQIPDLRKLYKKYYNKGFEVISISMDASKEKWLAAIQADKQPWKAYCELTDWRANKFAARFNTYAIPDNFLIDENGILAGQHLSMNAIRSWLMQHY
ncbi:MAG: TlpA family protein disulfide reductase [Chitinophagaceae bacterium]|nr:TlpA family protein disulfide reductase [Chitinophagaceae bacterium]